jgi:phenylpropionate dioxygenase-like ring-hydroxylating dioxygenase large terminal subunit
MSEARQINSAGISYQELIAQDVVPPPVVLTLQNRYQGGPLTVPIARYRDRHYHDLEMKELWPKVWQMACRVEEIPTVGDYTIYEIGNYSILIVNTSEGIRAHHNVCRHRGRQLCDFPGHASNFICPFHGFAWNLDGTSRQITSEWDFQHVNRKDIGLTPVRAEVWGGWVFINMDMNAEPLSAFVGGLADHFAIWEPENRYVQAHVAKVMNCNWKLCQEAFMEAFHVITTHPQILVGTGDENTQYDAWENFSRAITPNGTPSPHLRFKPSEQDLFDAVTMRYLDREGPTIPAGSRARAVLAQASREALRPITGDRVIADSEVSDSIYYTLFPNFHPWGGFNRITYRFRPYKDHHDKSIMECYYMAPFAGERPPQAPMHWLDEDQDWTEAFELGALAKVFQQDSFNLPKVQKGLAAAQFNEAVLARYQETKVRHFHELYARWLRLD